MGNERRPKSKLIHASDVLQSLLQNSKSPLSQQFQRWRLWSNWEDVVGPTVAKNTCPVAYSKGVLYIWVSSSVYMQELTFIAKPLKDKINEHVGKKWLHSVRFTMDRKSVPQSAEKFQDWRDFLSKSAPNGDGAPESGQ